METVMTLELEKAKKENDGTIEVIRKEVDALSITSNESLKLAVAVVSRIKETAKKIDDARKFFVKPLNDQVDKINALFKPGLETLKKLEVETKAKITSYQLLQLELAKAEEERLQKEQEKRYLKELKKAEKNETLPPPPPPPPKVEVPKVEGLSIRKVWDFEIVDISKIPLEYLIPDEKKIRKIINAGVRDIPGIKIFEKFVSVVKDDKEEDKL